MKQIHDSFFVYQIILIHRKTIFLYFKINMMKTFVKNILGLIFAFLVVFDGNSQTLRTSVNNNLGDSQIITAIKLRNTLNVMADSVSSKASISSVNNKFVAINTDLSSKASVSSVALKANVTSPVFQNDAELGSLNSGIIIKSPNGTRFRLTVSDTGDITATSLNN